jgi:phospholipid N-methyltransferase
MTKNNEIIFTNDSIYLKDKPELFVMMDWEDSLMKKHAEIVTQFGGDILEIGFGMGISASYIQSYGCKTHTIVELHPELYQRALEFAKIHPNVIVINGDWFELRKELVENNYDGIWYDADCANIMSFDEQIVNNLTPRVFTYFDPKGIDRYNYGSEFRLDEIIIDVDIEENIYHNDKICKAPFIIFKCTLDTDKTI